MMPANALIPYTRQAPSREGSEQSIVMNMGAMNLNVPSTNPNIYGGGGSLDSSEDVGFRSNWNQPNRNAVGIVEGSNTVYLPSHNPNVYRGGGGLDTSGDAGFRSNWNRSNWNQPNHNAVGIVEGSNNVDLPSSNYPLGLDTTRGWEQAAQNVSGSNYNTLANSGLPNWNIGNQQYRGNLGRGVGFEEQTMGFGYAMEQTMGLEHETRGNETAGDDHGRNADYHQGLYLPYNAQPNNALSDEPVKDIVKEFQNRNRAPKAPDPSLLQQYSQRQDVVRQMNEAQPDNEDDGEDDDDDDDDDSDENVAASRTSSRKAETRPHLLAFYPKGMSDLILAAKSEVYRHLVLNDPFPRPRNECFSKMLQEAIRSFAEDGRTVEAGYLEEYENNILLLLYKDISSFRSGLKKKAVGLIQAAYNLPLSADEMPEELENPTAEETKNRNQLLVKLTRDKITVLLDDDVANAGHFCKNGKHPVTKKTNNLQHPAIPQVIKQIFYTDKSAMARKFPADFTEKVPDGAFALAATIIQNCLEEFQNGRHIAKKFTAEEYNPSYLAVLWAIERVRTDPNYHGPELERNLVKWAQAGRLSLSTPFFLKRRCWTEPGQVNEEDWGDFGLNGNLPGSVYLVKSTGLSPVALTGSKQSLCNKPKSAANPMIMSLPRPEAPAHGFTKLRLGQKPHQAKGHGRPGAFRLSRHITKPEEGGAGWWHCYNVQSFSIVEYSSMTHPGPCFNHPIQCSKDKDVDHVDRSPFFLDWHSNAPPATRTRQAGSQQ
ncbi:hypothetical protein BT96DRAFT_939316 [Gymnopus androsaceus JB14]|uniref:DUF6532 domain-containing protein n=1 Tax=Gymnopus androsaceus JB14 TaxID=1447944 RepID=A0A6A4HRQ1_9AGAR|nr:hypothetical protein BT96DRAFT_939316 [Gymnopus androsaceus JB14]